MMNNKQYFNIGAVVVVSLALTTGCSFFGRFGKSVRNATTFDDQSKVAVNEELVLPPSLKKPAATTKVRNQKQPIRRTASRTQSSRNYYVVVGTYPDQEQALDTFVRLSSIGLPGATMESRKTQNGKVLHMVRLGPYQDQSDIDRVKDSLTSDGLSQFKVVEN